MAVLESPTVPGQNAEVEVLKALRTVGYPVSGVSHVGAYSVSARSGIMAAGLAANSEVFQWQWTHATRVLMIRKVRISGGGIAAFAAGAGNFSMRLARSWTVNGGSGTLLAFGTDDNKKKTSMLQVTGLTARIATTAAMAAGTKTLDGNDFFSDAFGVTATAGATLGKADYMWRREVSDNWPGLFVTNEGFILKAIVPATGTWTFDVGVEFDIFEVWPPLP